MDVRRISRQIEALCDRLGLSYELEIAETGSHYYRLDPNCDDSFTVRVADHGQVYGNPKYCLDPEGTNTYAEVRVYLTDLAKREAAWRQNQIDEARREGEALRSKAPPPA